MARQCPVCLGDVDTPAECDPCGHVACFLCVAPWLEGRRALGASPDGDCPVCRGPVEKLNVTFVVPPPVQPPPAPPVERGDAGVDFITVVRDGIRVRAFCRKHGLDPAVVLATNKGRATAPWPEYTNGRSTLRRGTTVWLHPDLVGGG